MHPQARTSDESSLDIFQRNTTSHSWLRSRIQYLDLNASLKAALQSVVSSWPAKPSDANPKTKVGWKFLWVLALTVLYCPRWRGRQIMRRGLQLRGPIKSHLIPKAASTSEARWLHRDLDRARLRQLTRNSLLAALATRT